MINGRYTLTEAAALLLGPTADPAARKRLRDALYYAAGRGQLRVITPPPGHRRWLVEPADLATYAHRRWGPS